MANSKLDPFLYDTILFEGVNSQPSRCVSLHGVTDALYATKHIRYKHIRRVGGIGTGALNAVLIACKLDKNTMLSTLRNLFHNSHSKHYKRGGFLNNITRNLVCSSQSPVGDHYVCVVKDLLKINTTFEDLYQTTGVHLRLSGVNLTTRSVVYFDHIYTPDMSVEVALNICVNNPFTENPIVYKNNKFTSSWLGNTLPRMFEEYTDKTVVICLMKCTYNKHVLGKHTIFSDSNVSKKRSSIDAINDATRTELESSYNRQYKNTIVFCVDDVNCISNNDELYYDWLYNIGYNTVINKASM